MHSTKLKRDCCFKNLQKTDLKRKFVHCRLFPSDIILQEEVLQRWQESLGWTRKFVNILPAFGAFWHRFSLVLCRWGFCTTEPQVLIAFKQNIKLNSFPGVNLVVFDRETSTSLDGSKHSFIPMSQLKAVSCHFSYFYGREFKRTGGCRGDVWCHDINVSNMFLPRCWQEDKMWLMVGVSIRPLKRGFSSPKLLQFPATSCFTFPQISFTSTTKQFNFIRT